MARPADAAWTAALAAVLYLAAWQLSPPLPYPSLGVLLGGLLALWLGSGRRAVVAGGALAGLVLGVIVHAVQHAVQPQLWPAEGLPLHLLQDTGFGLAVGGAVLAMVAGAYAVKQRRTARS